MAERRLQAVVFDFDGIIADTEHLHHQGFQAILEPMGWSIPWSTYVAEYIGFDDRDAFRHAYAQADEVLDDATLQRLVEAKAAWFAAAVQQRTVPTYPGVLELIAALRLKLPLALCTGALCSDIEPILARHKMQHAFQAVVTAEDVTQSKPHPESYQRAVQALGVDPAHALAFEDTPTGIRSARAAGLYTVGVSHTHSAAELGAADRVIPGFPGTTPEDLAFWLA